jgi:hypothetical protein
MNFTFTADASGSADAITLPQSFPMACRRILVRPPAGHAWTVHIYVGGTGYPLDVDREFAFERSSEESPFKPGETIGYAVLDTGSGTFYGIGT